MKIKPLYHYKTEELLPLAGKLVTEYTNNNNEYATRETLQGDEQIHKIYLIYHLMGGLNSLNWELEQKISKLNAKIAEQGKEISKLKRQNTGNT